jgi:c-di-GMP-binding flagellar brake protein YcgR
MTAQGSEAFPSEPAEPPRAPRGRLSRRARVDIPIECRLPDSGGLFRGRIVDISGTGVRVSVRARLSPGVPVLLRFAIGDREIETTAHIVHFAEGQDGRHHGMRFADLTTEDRAVIARFVFATLAVQETTMY